jgi:hypothetical protein
LNQWGIKNITREESICKNCNLNEIGDEYHFFLKCTANHSLRNNLFNKIILNKPDFIEEIPLNKRFSLLDANSELLAEVGDFIKQSTELQKWGPCRAMYSVETCKLICNILQIDLVQNLLVPLLDTDFYYWKIM